jgi:hypothetical protein
MEVREFFSDFSDRISVMIFSRVFILFYYEFYPKKRQYYKIFLEKSEKFAELYILILIVVLKKFIMMG